MRSSLTRRHIVKSGLALGAAALAAPPILAYGQGEKPIKIGMTIR